MFDNMAIIKVAYLGPKNTYTEKAAKLLFPDAELLPFTHIKKVILAVEEAEVNFGVVPFENIYNGKVIHTLDALTNQSKKSNIVQEISMPITHCLGALKGHSEITQIQSKDQALEQCDAYLSDKYPGAELIAVSSTTLAVNKIIQENLVNAAAIASKEGLNGLGIIEEDICPNNKTRFFVISNQPTKPTGDDKTFISFHPHLTDEAGVLYRCLGPLNKFKINMGDIFSRPDGNSTQRGFHFFIELKGHQEDFLVKSAIEELKKYLDPENKFTDAVRVFGSYPDSHWDE